MLFGFTPAAFFRAPHTSSSDLHGDPNWGEVAAVAGQISHQLCSCDWCLYQTVSYSQMVRNRSRWCVSLFVSPNHVLFKHLHEWDSTGLTAACRHTVKETVATARVKPVPNVTRMTFTSKKESSEIKKNNIVQLWREPFLSKTFHATVLTVRNSGCLEPHLEMELNCRGWSAWAHGCTTYQMLRSWAFFLKRIDQESNASWLLNFPKSPTIA